MEAIKHATHTNEIYTVPLTEALIAFGIESADFVGLSAEYLADESGHWIRISVHRKTVP